MKSRFWHRALLFLVSCLVIYLINFAIPRLMPGDPFDYTASGAGEDVTYAYSQEQKELLRAYYGLDAPWPQQLADTLSRNLRGDFGQSIHFNRPVSEILLERLPWSLWIMGVTLLLSLLLGTVLALICVGTKRGHAVLSPILSALAELPPFLTGVMLLFLVAAQVSWIPLSGAVTPFVQFPSIWAKLWDVVLHSLMPISALTLVTLPSFFFTAWASFTSTLQQPYMTNARAKGLRRRRVWPFYLLANSATPIIARLFLSVGSTVGGTILVENVFAYPGLGTVLREAVAYRDYPMIQGVFLPSAGLVLVSLALADVCNHAADEGVFR